MVSKKQETNDELIQTFPKTSITVHDKQESFDVPAGSSNSNSNSQTSNSNYSFQTQTQTVDVYILKHQTQTQTLFLCRIFSVRKSRTIF